jgi:hypothetical protein
MGQIAPLLVALLHALIGDASRSQQIVTRIGKLRCLVLVARSVLWQMAMASVEVRP